MIAYCEKCDAELPVPTGRISCPTCGTPLVFLLSGCADGLREQNAKERKGRADDERKRRAVRAGMIQLALLG